VQFRGLVKPATMVPGGSVQVELTASPQGEYHLYPYSATPLEMIGSSPTLILFSKLGNWTISGPVLKGKVEKKEVNGQSLSYHHDPVTWVYTLTSSADQPLGVVETIRGSIAYQTCTFSGCDQPAAVAFEFELPVAESAEESGSPTVYDCPKRRRRVA
jgi:hypothetical protein